MACAVTAPPRMGQRVLAATYQIRQLPPVPGPDRERRRVHAERVLARRFPRRLTIAAAAASVAAAVALGVTQLSAQHQLDSARSSAAAIARVVTAPDARVATERVGPGNVTVVTSAALHEAVVSATGMAPLSSGRVYQVWVMSPSGARSVGLIPAGQARANSLLASAVKPGDRIGITVEPAGGTKRPTTRPVAVLPA
jgi:hypothetical protein